MGNETVVDSFLPGYLSATNNEMELEACIAALTEAQQRNLADGLHKIVVHTDSQYVCDNVNKAIFEWPKTRWHTRSGTPVLNAEQWKKLARIIKSCGHRVEFRWVKGHAKDPHNKAADKMARKSAKSAIRPPLTEVSVRRKRTRAKVVHGCVRLDAQRLTVRVITCQWLHTQRVWKLKYEVMSKASPFYGLVDIAFSDELLRDGHTYFVKMGDDTKNPRIAKLYREVGK